MTCLRLYAAQVFYNPAGTSLGWHEFKKLDEYRAIKPDAENAKMLHQKYPLPASLDELVR